MNDDHMQNFPMGKYLVQFAGISLAISVALMIFTMVTGIELPGATGIITLIATLAAIAPGIAKAIGREMTKTERSMFALWSSLITLAISALLIAGSLGFAGIPLTLENLGAIMTESGISPMILLLIAAAALAIGWVATYFILGAFVKQNLKRLQSAAKQ